VVGEGVGSGGVTGAGAATADGGGAGGDGAAVEGGETGSTTRFGGSPDLFFVNATAPTIPAISSEPTTAQSQVRRRGASYAPVAATEGAAAAAMADAAEGMGVVILRRRVPVP
jgi:hypothetical protein